MAAEDAPCMRVGLADGRTTGANALFCLTALIILAGLKEKAPAAEAIGSPEVDRVLGGNAGD